MKKVLAVFVLFTFCCTFVWAEDESEFESSTQVLLVANGVLFGPEVGLGLDLSVVPHFVGSFAFTFNNVIMRARQAGRFEFVIKYFFHHNNTGLYASIGPSFYTTFLFGINDIIVSYFLAGVGAKAKFLRFLVFDVNLSAPVSMLFRFEYPPGSYDYYDYYSNITAVFLGSLKISLGINL